MTELDRITVTTSLRDFKKRRDALLHGDSSEMEHHLRRFVEFSEDDPVIKEAMQLFPQVNTEDWWAKLQGDWRRRGPQSWEFPSSRNEEMSLRYALIRDVVNAKISLYSFGDAMGVFDRNEQKQRFLSLIVQPFCETLTDDLREIANMPSEEIRALQAVPLHLIPGEKEIRIFLSHKSTDKRLIRRYNEVLRELGFAPWLDVEDMPAGTQLDRGIAQGFEESCAAIFFMTENFKDERFLRDEINYAKIQERNKGRKFSIITLRFDKSIEIPLLLQPYIYIDVENELEGLHELLRALPIELGPVRWKKRVI